MTGRFLSKNAQSRIRRIAWAVGFLGWLAVAGGAQEQVSDGELFKRAKAAIYSQPPKFAEATRLLKDLTGRRDNWWHPKGLTKLALVCRFQGRPWEGLAHLRRAQRILRQWELKGIDGSGKFVRQSRLYAIDELARTYIAIGLPDLAEAQLDSLLKSCDSMFERCHATLLMLDVRLAQADWRLVRSRAKRALKDEALLDPVEGSKWEFAFRLSLAERHLVARKSLPQVGEALESLVGHGLDERHEVRALLEAAEVWIETGDLQRARAANERVLVPADAGVSVAAQVVAQRARIAMSSGADGEELVELRRELLTAAEAWFEAIRRSPLRDGGNGAFRFRARRDIVETLLALDRAVLKTRAFETAFDHLESALSTGTLSRRFERRRATLEDARKLVPDAGGVLMFGFSPYSGSLLVIDHAGSEHHVVKLDRRFWLEAYALREAVDSPPASAEEMKGAVAAVHSIATKVADRILPEKVRERIGGWSRVLLIGHENTGRILQALAWGDSWWCLEQPLVHAPSVTVAVELAQRSKKAPSKNLALDLVAIGDPRIDERSEKRWGVATLGLDRKERARFTSAFVSDRVRAHWGEAATRGALFDPAVGDAASLCLFTHGVQDFERERSAGFLLGSTDGSRPVFADEVASMSAVPPLVLLGVCGAAAGPTRFGDDGAHHLGGAFLLAGSHSVVLAHGGLSLGATRDLLTRSLGEWRNGHDIAEAMRRARRQVAGVPQRAHPYFFAGLRVVGSSAESPGRVR